jgi:hypothetical protein
MAADDTGELVSAPGGFKANLLSKRSDNTENGRFDVVYQQAFCCNNLLCFFCVLGSQA